MSTATTEEHTYLLGHSEAELERLQRQSDFYAPLTAQALRLAGIMPGMRVLDVGCGAGDVSILAARMVGPTGEVIAVDRSAEALETAEEKIARSGLDNVHLVQEDVATVRLDAPADAIIGRLVLMHLSDPVGALRNLSTNLHWPGVILFQEMDIAMARTEPPVPLAESMIELVRKTFTGAGIDTRPGLRLHEQFVAAGLPAPELVSLGRVEAAPAPASSALLTGILTTLLPAMSANGLATADELALDTLPDRIATVTRGQSSLFFTPPLMTAWSHIGEYGRRPAAGERR